MKEFLIAFTIFIVIVFGISIYAKNNETKEPVHICQEQKLKEEIATLKKHIETQKGISKTLNTFTQEYFIAWKNCKSRSNQCR